MPSDLIMTDIFCLDPAYSTTRLVTKIAPVIENQPDSKFRGTLFLPPNTERKGEGGLRIKGYFKQSLPDKPLITVITVVFNGAAHLEETIKNTIDQTYDNVEFIIIDGGSTDGTVDVIKKYEGQIDYWVSEKDKGIYDAMNKGIDLATGLWVNFMNSGDIFYDNNTLMVFSEYMHGTDAIILYGDFIYDYILFKQYRKAKPLRSFWQGMRFCHQSSFIALGYHRLNKYNIDYSISADFEFFLRSYVSGILFLYIAVPVALESVGGVSDRYGFDARLQDRKAVRIHCPSIKHECYYLYTRLDGLLRTLAKCILPRKLINKIRGILYQSP